MRIIPTNHENYRIVEVFRERGLFEPEIYHNDMWLPLDITGKINYRHRIFYSLVGANRAIIRAMKLNGVQVREVTNAE